MAIYCVQNMRTMSLKIGYSEKPPGRLRTFNTGNEFKLRIIGVIPGGKEEERCLHRQFAHLRIDQGKEWFRGTPELYKVVEQMFGAPLKIWGHEVSEVYLAGRITGDTWRDEILAPARSKAGYRVEDEDDRWSRPGAVTVPGDTRRLNYRGPFWLRTEHDCRDNTGAHAFGNFDEIRHSMGRVYSNATTVRAKCLDGVEASHLVFAWVESRESYGTFAEIVHAHSVRRLRSRATPLIVVATPHRELSDHVWFIFGMADHFIVASTPSEAWASLWASRRMTPCSFPESDESTRDFNEGYDYDNL